MFRTISIIVFLVAIAAIVLHRCVARSAPAEGRRPGGIFASGVYLLTLLLLPQHLTLLGKLKKLVYLLAFLCVLVLAATGFYPVLVLGKDIAGYPLMVHVTAGGVFAVCLAVLVLTWAHAYRFSDSDWPWLSSLIRRRLQKDPFLPRSTGVGRKICFWLLAVLALPVMLSVVLSMFPLFGTAGQNLLADTHRYSALAFAAVAIIHTYLIIRKPKIT